jgi:glutathione synthase/RimK-type ligase-like ATP-grasp enzyme
MVKNTNRKKRIILIGYKLGSKSLRNLQSNLKKTQNERRVLRVRKTSTTYKRRPSDVIVAWGPTAPCPHTNATQEAAKKIASNKLLSFHKFKEHGVATPEWTENPQEALSWVTPTQSVVARHLLCSHSGKGISIITNENLHETSLIAKLYVQYKKKKHEYRIHVFNGKVIDITQKKRKVGFENRNNQIRNHQNGWIYARDNVYIPQGMESLALAACTALGLLSGAVDIIWNEKENKCYVLEINTAPGIEGTTCNKYTQEIIQDLS